MTSISVVLPAPFGPIRQRSSPLSRIRVRLFSALKPSKLTLTLSTHKIAGRPATTTSRRPGSMVLGRTDHGRRDFSGSTAGALRTVGTSSDKGSSEGGTLLRAGTDMSSTFEALDDTRGAQLQATEGACNAVGEKQGHRDEERTEDVQPGIGHGRSEKAAHAVDHECA